MATSVQDDLLPDQQEHQRADVDLWAWIIRKSGEKVVVTFLYHEDARYIPTARWSFVSYRTWIVRTIRAIDTYLKHNGVPMHCVAENTEEGLAVSVKKETFDHSSGVYELEYDISFAEDQWSNRTGRAGLVTLNVDHRM